MPVEVNKEICIGCGSCVGVCPVEAISLDEEGKAESNSEICIDCGACMGTCPMSAIEQK
ncbi:MAG: 4Fe-4S binding protein [Erysipelotrichaceae bacterium]|nr:4Fe-4S binding protein [Erysipelotrichaceae bacterium]